MSQYRAGTVAVTNGNTLVTGSVGVDWSSVTTAHRFYVDGDSQIYGIISVNSGARTLTLATPYQSTTDPAAEYSIVVDFSPNFGLPYINEGDLATRPLWRLLVDILDVNIGGGGGGGGGGSPVNAPYLLIGSNNATLTADRRLQTTAPVLLTDGGANGTATISLDFATQAEAIAGTVANKVMSPLRTAEAIANAGGGGGVTDHGALFGLADDDHTQYYNQTRLNSWIRGSRTFAVSTTLDGSLDPALTWFGRTIRIDNSAGARVVTLPTLGGVAGPSGLFCQIVASSGAFNVSITVQTSGQLRSQNGRGSWNPDLDTVFVGWSTAAADETVIDVYKFGTTLWVLSGPMRAVSTDDLTAVGGTVADGAITTPKIAAGAQGAVPATPSFVPTAINLAANSMPNYTQAGAVQLALAGGVTPVGGMMALVSWVGDGANVTCDGTTVKWWDGTNGAKAWTGLQHAAIAYHTGRGYAVATVTGLGGSAGGGSSALINGGTFVPAGVSLALSAEYTPYVQAPAATVAFALAGSTPVAGAYVSVLFTGTGDPITWTSDFKAGNGTSLSSGDYASFIGTKRLEIRWSATEGKALVYLSGTGVLGGQINQAWTRRAPNLATTGSSQTLTINFALGDWFQATIAHATPTIALTGFPIGAVVGVMLALVNGGSQTITWPAALRWPQGIVPAFTASGTDLIAIWLDGNGVYHANVASYASAQP